MYQNLRGAIINSHPDPHHLHLMLWELKNPLKTSRLRRRGLGTPVLFNSQTCVDNKQRPPTLQSPEFFSSPPTIYSLYKAGEKSKSKKNTPVSATVLGPPVCVLLCLTRKSVRTRTQCSRSRENGKMMDSLDGFGLYFHSYILLFAQPPLPLLYSLSIF